MKNIFITLIISGYDLFCVCANCNSNLPIFHLGTTLHVYETERTFDLLFHMHELVKIDLPTHKPNGRNLITFIETLATIRNLIVQSVIQIEIIEKLIKVNDFHGYNSSDDDAHGDSDGDSDDDSDGDSDDASDDDSDDDSNDASDDDSGTTILIKTLSIVPNHV